MEDLQLLDNPAKHRFEMNLGDDFAFIEYSHFKHDLVILHTYVPESHRGMGIAGKMFKQLLDGMRTKEIKLIVYCPALSKYIDSHPEYADLLDENYRK